MKKEELFNDDFLKQFKTGDELNGFLKALQKRGIEKMLEGELDGHLDYGKHQRSKAGNSRNGHSKKKVRTSFGESEITVPRDRDASFNPMIVPKRGNMVDGIENVIISLYAKGMSNSDIEEQIREVYDFDVSTGPIRPIFPDLPSFDPQFPDEPRNEPSVCDVLKEENFGPDGYSGSICATDFGVVVPGISVQNVPIFTFRSVPF